MDEETRHEKLYAVSCRMTDVRTMVTLTFSQRPQNKYHYTMVDEAILALSTRLSELSFFSDIFLQCLASIQLHLQLQTAITAKHLDPDSILHVLVCKITQALSDWMETIDEQLFSNFATDSSV